MYIETYVQECNTLSCYLAVDWYVIKQLLIQSASEHNS